MYMCLASATNFLCMTVATGLSDFTTPIATDIIVATDT
jgi:hypothetical protein